MITKDVIQLANKLKQVIYYGKMKISYMENKIGFPSSGKERTRCEKEKIIFTNTVLGLEETYRKLTDYNNNELA